MIPVQPLSFLYGDTNVNLFFNLNYSALNLLVSVERLSPPAFQHLSSSHLFAVHTQLRGRFVPSS